MKFIVRSLVAVLLLTTVFKGGAVSPVTTGNDSVADLRPLVDPPLHDKKTFDITSKKWFQMTYIGVPLVVAGVAVMPGRDRFRQLRDDYAPNFHYKYDDYLQYAPAAVMLGLKGFGVESRSSWGRMLVSDAFSAAIMATVVNTIKYTAHVRRPTGAITSRFPRDIRRRPS